MFERMTDERLAEIDEWFMENAIQGPWEDHMNELLQALKAEREWAKACTRSGSEQCALRDTRIAELEATIDRVKEQILLMPQSGSGYDYWVARLNEALGDKPCNHQWRKVTGQEWLKCMECGVVRD